MQLRIWLERRDMTQGDLAKRVNHSTPFICGILNGHHSNIKISLLRKLHKITSIPMPKLVDDLLAKNEAYKKNSRRR